jgi:ribonuclease R
VPVRDLADDYYDFDEKNYCLVGRRRNNRYRLGDAIQVQVARCDLDKKLLDFVVVDKNNPPRGAEELASKKAISAPSHSDKKSKSKSKSKKKSSKRESKRESKRRRK